MVGGVACVKGCVSTCLWRVCVGGVRPKDDEMCAWVRGKDAQSTYGNIALSRRKKHDDEELLVH